MQEELSPYYEDLWSTLWRACGPDPGPWEKGAMEDDARADLFALAERHRVSPLLWKRLRPSGDAGLAPWHALRLAARANAFRTLMVSGELVTLAAAFSARRLPLIPFKGVVTATRLYGDPTARHSGDLDLLIAEGDLAAAHGILQAHGYQPLFPHRFLEEERLPLVRAYRCDLEYFHPDKQLRVELHWRWRKSRHLMPLSFAYLLANCDRMTLASIRLPQMPLRTHFLYLCLHGTFHHWCRLKWVCDIRFALAREPLLAEESDEVWQEAYALGVERALATILLLIQEEDPSFDHPLLHHPLLADGHVQHLTKASRRALHQPLADASGGFSRRLFTEWHLTPRLGARLLLLLKLLVPNDNDLANLGPLPPWPALLVLLRPAFWVLRRLG